MKNFTRRLPVKILCFILCVLFLCATVVSAFGTIFIALEGFYTRTEEEVLWDAVYRDVSIDANVITFSAASGEDYHVDEIYAKDKTNLRYAVFDDAGNLKMSNFDGNGSWDYYFSFEIYKDIYDNWNVNLARSGDTMISGKNIWTFAVYLEEGFPVDDEYSFYATFVSVLYSLRYWIFAIALGSFALFLTLFITLLCASGRRPNSDEVHAGYLNKIPFDVVLAGACALAIAFLLLLDETDHDEIAYAISVIVSLVAAPIILIGLSMSIATRIKQHSLLKNTVVWRVCKLVWKFFKFIAGEIVRIFRALPMIWRGVTVLTVNAILDLIFVCMIIDRDFCEIGVFLSLSKTAILFGLGIYAAIFMRRLQKGAQALADGNLSYQTDTKAMYWDFKKHGENLNRISEGMSAAVEKRLQSERMKAELITNVSHDIKTPLTSIINYSSLISEEKCDCEKHAEYSEVLVRKSEHLKRLLDDLVEISKAQSGNLDVELTPCDANVLLTQASGEYMQKCENAGLELVTAIPEGRIRIMADGRRIWRVFENLLNNAVKYSLSGSRVYISLARYGDFASFTFRNTSKTMLNITPDELTERFVRGDTSRSTEGNGLGLSIAKSLTELQNGKMDIDIDGDLFKVTLLFPIVE
jgi:signal transduction histidine kinase